MTGFYYVSSRYYDPETCRWINADNQLSTGSDLTGMNLFAYCGNNPVNRIDPTGEAWWHWALGAAVVAACAVARVVTCGGFAAAATAVCMVGSGVAAATTASTIAAGAFIGSATAYGMAVYRLHPHRVLCKNLMIKEIGGQLWHLSLVLFWVEQVDMPCPKHKHLEYHQTLDPQVMHQI